MDNVKDDKTILRLKRVEKRGLQLKFLKGVEAKSKGGT